MRTIICLGFLGMMLVMVGCTPIRTKSPLATCPLAQKVAHLDNGTIYQTGTIRPLFEDRHARNVGDELIVSLGESTTPSDKGAGNPSNPSTVNAGLPTTKKGDKEDSGGNKTFSGNIVVTVIGVLANGKLVVCGDKLVKYANADVNFEYVRFSGIVNPTVISYNNTIKSTQVADVQIEYRSADNGESTQTFFSRLDRFFLPKQLFF